MLPDNHLGFHYNCENMVHKTGKGLFKGRSVTIDGEESIKCTLYVPSIDPVHYLLKTERGDSPRIRFKLHEFVIDVPISQYVTSLREQGFPMSTVDSRNLTAEVSLYINGLRNWSQQIKSQINDRLLELCPDLSLRSFHDHLGYVVDGNVLKVIPFESSIEAFERSTPDDLKEEEMKKHFLELYSLSSDPASFLITAAYSIMAPFAGLVRRRGLFSPDMALLGEPESGKTALVKMFAVYGWGTESNLMSSGDFKTEFASLENMTGEGLPIVVSDLEQENFDRLKAKFLGSSDTIKVGSRGTKSLSLVKFEIARSFILTSNYIQFDAKEIVDRFITLHMKGKRGNEDR